MPWNKDEAAAEMERDANTRFLLFGGGAAEQQRKAFYVAHLQSAHDADRGKATSTDSDCERCRGGGCEWCHNTGKRMILMPLSDVNDLDAVVHALGIEDSDTTPAEAVAELHAEIERLRATSPRPKAAVEAPAAIERRRGTSPIRVQHGQSLAAALALPAPALSVPEGEREAAKPWLPAPHPPQELMRAACNIDGGTHCRYPDCDCRYIPAAMRAIWDGAKAHVVGNYHAGFAAGEETARAALSALPAPSAAEREAPTDDLAMMLRRMIWQIERREGDISLKVLAGKARQLLLRYGLYGSPLRDDIGHLDGAAPATAEREAVVYSDTMDPDCIPLCDAMNRLPGITTCESCCGHGERPHRIFFRARRIEDLSPILECAESSPWRVDVRWANGNSTAVFMLEGPVGAADMPGGSRDFTSWLLARLDGAAQEGA